MLPDTASLALERLPSIIPGIDKAAKKVEDFVTIDDHDVVEYNKKSKSLEFPEYLDVSVGVTALESIHTRFVNCWLVNYSYTYDQGSYLIAENATIWAEVVQDENAPRPRKMSEADAIEGNYNDRIAAMRGTAYPLKQYLAPST
jgi:hypothetical protein